MWLAAIACIVALQFVGATIFAPPALAAQYALEWLVDCCGEAAGMIGAPLVFLGLIAAIWWALARWQDRRWRRRITAPPAGK